MPRQLWFLRHGDAIPHGAKSDSDRELTPLGERQAQAAGRALARLGIEFEHCYASPKVRARETARLACEALGVNFEEVSSLAAGFDAGDLRELLHAHGEGDAPLLFVGHEPDFSQVVHDLTGARVDLKKGGVAAVKSSSSPELVALMRPLELESLAGLPGQ